MEGERHEQVEAEDFALARLGEEFEDGKVEPVDGEVRGGTGEGFEECLADDVEGLVRLAHAVRSPVGDCASG